MANSYKEIRNLEDKIKAIKHQIPTDIGSYIINNVRIHYVTKNGKNATRKIKDYYDFRNHFDVVEKNSSTTKDTKPNTKKVASSDKSIKSNTAKTNTKKATKSDK